MKNLLKLIDESMCEAVFAFERWVNRIVIPSETRKHLFTDVMKLKDTPVCGDEIMQMRGY